MATKSQILKFKRTVNVPPAEVHRAFTNSTALRQWLCDTAQADAHKGGRLYLWWNSGYYTSGEFTGLVPGKKVAFTWRGPGESDVSLVQVVLAAKDDSTALTITHTGVGSGRKWARTIEEFTREWETALENLQSVLETGQDLRYVRRPMLGINVGEFNAEVAANLGVPVTEGIRLEGVLEGMGAHAAGLLKDDVIVGLGGKKITGWVTLVAALQARRAGDKVAVAFYRGSEKKTVTMELSQRRLPEVPPTAEALAEAVRQMHVQLDAELDTCFEGVPEGEVAHRPAADEWSAKDTLAHLIAAEREAHAWIADLINDDERWSDRFENPTSVPARICAIVTVFPTVPALLQELKRHQAETVAMLAALPVEFVARKRSYWPLGRDLLETPEHFRTHFNQIRAAIEAARRV